MHTVGIQKAKFEFRQIDVYQSLPATYIVIDRILTSQSYFVFIGSTILVAIAI
jgi:hypothetical protein